MPCLLHLCRQVGAEPVAGVPRQHPLEGLEGAGDSRGQWQFILFLCMQSAATIDSFHANPSCGANCADLVNVKRSECQAVRRRRPARGRPSGLAADPPRLLEHSVRQGVQELR